MFPSEGLPSPWDRDVDDTMSLLSVAFEHVPELDEERVAILGSSRGGAVALLAAVRNRRIDAVVEFFGPTDFFGEYAREIFEEALEGELRDLPGLEYFNETVIQPGRTRPRFPTALGCPSGPRCYLRPLETLAPDTGHAWHTSGGREGGSRPPSPHTTGRTGPYPMVSR